VSGDWVFRIWGQVERPAGWSWEEILALPRSARTVDLRPLDGETRPALRWGGVSARELLSRVRLLPDATHVMVHATGGPQAGLPLSVFAGPDVIFAHALGDHPLTAEQGGPLRLVVPGYYSWKWVEDARGVEFLNKPWPDAAELAGLRAKP